MTSLPSGLVRAYKGGFYLARLRNDGIVSGVSFFEAGYAPTAFTFAIMIKSFVLYLGPIVS